jgi:hypothetical protein
MNREYAVQLKWMVLIPILVFVIGFEVGSELIRAKLQSVNADAPNLCQEKNDTIAQQQRSLDVARETIGALQLFIAQQRADLARAVNNPGAQLLARFGHVMNEQQCRDWIGVMSPQPVSQ